MRRRNFKTPSHIFISPSRMVENISNFIQRCFNNFKYFFNFNPDKLIVQKSLSTDVLKAVGVRPLVQGVLLWLVVSISSLAYIPM